MKLFKYRPLDEYAVNWISRNELYFRNAGDLDDPFDCAIRVNFTGGSKDQYRNLISLGIKEQLKNLVLSDDQFNEIVDRHLNEQMQNITQFSKEAEDGFRHGVLSKKGVLSLSETNNNVLMWSHYAAGHSGVCLQFEASEIMNSARKVNYFDELPSINIFNQSFADLADQVLLSKQQQWSYQKEWRVIDPEFPPGVHRFIRPLLTGLILGAKTTSQDEQKVRELLREASLDISLKRARQTTHGAFMEIVTI